VIVNNFEKNLVECAFSKIKMVRSFLRHIRENSRGELKERILNGIAEINEASLQFLRGKMS